MHNYADNQFASKANLLLSLVCFFSVFANWHAFWSFFIIAFLQLAYIFYIRMNVKSNYRVLIGSWPTVILIGFLVCLMVSLFLYIPTANTEEVYLALLRCLFFLIHFYFAYSYLIHIEKYDLGYFLYDCIVAATTICALYFLLDYNYNIDTVISSSSFELPFFFNIRMIGFICCYSTIYLIYRIILSGDNEKKLPVFCIVYAINLVLLVWLGGRASLLATMISSLFIIGVFSYHKVLKSNRVQQLLLLTVISVIVSVPLNVLEWNGLNRVLTLFSDDTILTINELSSNRLVLWSDALTYIEKSFYFGNGPDSYRFLSITGQFQPHNFVLQFLFEVGIFGTFFLLGLVFYILVISLVKVLSCNVDGLNKLVMNLSLIGALVFQGLLDGTFYWSVTVMQIIICITSLYKACVYSHSTWLPPQAEPKL